jgi:hypothetical protein
MQHLYNVVKAILTAVTTTPSRYKSDAAEASKVVKNSAGTLRGFTVFNDSASAQFVQVHDAAAVPAEGAVPMIIIPVPSKKTVAFDAGIFGLPMTSGIVLCNSSTGATKTLGAANCIFTVKYS